MGQLSSLVRLFSWWVLLFAVSFFLSFLTKGGMSTWYQSLIRAPITPPSYIIGPVWSVLYLMMGYSAWLLWEAPEFDSQLFCQKLFIGQLLFNWLWTPLFFGAHYTGLALLCTLMMLILSSAYIYILKSQLPLAAYLLIPYIFWLLFAGYLNAFIWLYN